MEKEENQKAFMTTSELRKIRSNLGISQNQFAKYLGVQKSTYCFWEQNRNPISEWAANLIRLTADQIKKR